MRPGSARERVGREAVGVVRGEAVDEAWRGGSGLFGALPEGQEDSACCLEAAPRCEGVRLAGAESSFDGGEGVGVVGCERGKGSARREPAVEGATVVGPGLEGAGDDGHVDPGAGVAESDPEAAVAVDPAAEFRVGVAAGVGVDEGGRVVASRDGELVVKVAAGVVEGAAVGALREIVDEQAAAEEVAGLVQLGGKPGQ